MRNLAQLVPRLAGYKLFRAIGTPKLMPISLTVSITNQCNSRCRTCNIWTLYRDKPQLKEKELSLKEFETVFDSIGKSVYWVTLSGGEPFLRTDIAKLVEFIHDYLDPKILIIPTNGLLGQLVISRAKEILNTVPEASVIINLSLDGVGSRHDEIRGVARNFEKAMDTYGHLKELKKEFDNLEVGVHSVVSTFTVNELMGVYDFVKEELVPDSYICEIAEHRSELFNLNEDITPEVASYQNTIQQLRQRIKEDHSNTHGTPRLIQAFRLEYYKLVIEELKQKRQLIPCYAGYASGQISPYGDVWPCCILAYDASFGNLRDVDYDFRKIWVSKKADEVRKRIKAGTCYCPMANVHYTNMLLNSRTLLKVARNVLSSYF